MASKNEAELMKRQQGYKIPVLGVALICLSFSLSACAVETIPYPKLSTVQKLKNRILSPEEQEEVIRDLSAEQSRQKTSTTSNIEKSQ